MNDKWFVYSDAHWFDGAYELTSEESAREHFEELKKEEHWHDKRDKIYLLRVVEEHSLFKLKGEEGA